MPIQVRLIVIGGKASKADVALKLPSVIGRSREAGLTIAHPMVSRRHCEMFEADGLLMIRDLGSLNGTLVAGQRIKESPLPPDSEFTVGPLTFRTLYECERDLSKLPPPVLAEQDVAVTASSAPIESAAPDFQVVDEPSPPEPLPVSGPETQEVSFLDDILGESAPAMAPDVNGSGEGINQGGAFDFLSALEVEEVEAAEVEAAEVQVAEPKPTPPPKDQTLRQKPTTTSPPTPEPVTPEKTVKSWWLKKNLKSTSRLSKSPQPRSRWLKNPRLKPRRSKRRNPPSTSSRSRRSQPRSRWLKSPQPHPSSRWLNNPRRKPRWQKRRNPVSIS